MYKNLRQKERFIKVYWSIWYNSSFKDLTEQQISDYKKSWYVKRKQIEDEIGTSSDIKIWISFFVKKIYLQPIYYYEAVNLFPESLPENEKINRMFGYLKSKTIIALDKYNERIQWSYIEFCELLSKKDETAINDLKKILFFTEKLLSKVFYNIYDSPIMYEFVKAMFDLKSLYDFALPNDGLPRMNKYFNQVDASKFQLNFDTIKPLKKKTQQPEQEKPEIISKTDNLIKEKVENKLCFMLEVDPRKYEKILNDEDYNKLIEWVTYFFENNFKVPEINKPIDKINTAQGNIVYSFISLFDEIIGKCPRPDTLFELIKKCFYEYRNKDIENLKKATSKPNNYDNLVRKQY